MSVATSLIDRLIRVSRTFPSRKRRGRAPAAALVGANHRHVGCGLGPGVAPALETKRARVATSAGACANAALDRRGLEATE